MSTHDKGVAPGTGWDRLLGLLGEPAAAGGRYQELRRRLVRLFQLRGLAPGEDLADETLDRVARKLAAGEELRSADPVPFVCGVARLVALEALRAGRRLRPLDEAPEAAAREISEPPVDPTLRACLDECLGKMPAPARSLLVDYQVGDGGDRIANRRRLADKLGLPMNALRIRVHRLRQELQRCVETCAAGARDAGA